MADSDEARTALALRALGEITDPDDVGEVLAIEEVEPGVVDVRFACRMPAYADWHWTVSTSDLTDADPTVLEVELLPGDDSLLAPPWVPWTERLAEWRTQHLDEHQPGDSADDEPDEDEADDEPEDDDLDVGADDRGPDEDDADEDDADEDDADEDDADEDDAEVDDLAVDDELDELDETELVDVVLPARTPVDAAEYGDDLDDEDDDDDEEHLREV